VIAEPRSATTSAAGDSVTTGTPELLDDSGSTESIALSVVPGDAVGVVAGDGELVAAVLELGTATGSPPSSPPHAARAATAVVTQSNRRRRVAMSAPTRFAPSLARPWQACAGSIPLFGTVAAFTGRLPKDSSC
jgi:hypothetical protein